MAEWRILQVVVVDVGEVNQSADWIVDHPKHVVEHPEAIAEYPEAIIEYPEHVAEHPKAVAEYPVEYPEAVADYPGAIAGYPKTAAESRKLCQSSQIPQASRRNCSPVDSWPASTCVGSLHVDDHASLSFLVIN